MRTMGMSKTRLMSSHLPPYRLHSHFRPTNNSHFLHALAAAAAAAVAVVRLMTSWATPWHALNLVTSCKLVCMLCMTSFTTAHDHVLCKWRTTTKGSCHPLREYPVPEVSSTEHYEITTHSISPMHNSHHRLNSEHAHISGCYSLNCITMHTPEG